MAGNLYADGHEWQRIVLGHSFHLTPCGHFNQRQRHRRGTKPLSTKNHGTSEYGNGCIAYNSEEISFTVPRSCAEQGEGGSIANYLRAWFSTHEEAQVMLASFLVVVGIWWVVRTVLNLIVNLICPVLMVLVALICVPQLRAPLMGQNYPALASVLRSILLKLADNIKQ